MLSWDGLQEAFEVVSVFLFLFFNSSLTDHMTDWEPHLNPVSNLYFQNLSAHFWFELGKKTGDNPVGIGENGEIV